MFSELEVVAITLIAAIIAAFAQYYFKRYLEKFNMKIKEIIHIIKERHILFGLFLYAISFLLYLYALHGAPVVSFVYPIFASTFIFVFIISKYWLGEPIGTMRLIGMVLIVIGIGLIAMTY